VTSLGTGRHYPGCRDGVPRRGESQGESTTTTPTVDVSEVGAAGPSRFAQLRHSAVITEAEFQTTNDGLLAQS
jgi:hypothetical protein